MEPERPIEKVLRDCAQRRREEAGPPLELHPANRRMLQAEVARRSPKTVQENRGSSFLAGFRPRLAWVLCVAAIATVGGVLLFPSLDRFQKKAPMTLASGSSPSSPQPAPQAQALSPASTANRLFMSDVPAAEPKTATAGLQAKAQSETSPVNRPTVVSSRDQRQPTAQSTTASMPEFGKAGGFGGGGGAGGLVTQNPPTHIADQLEMDRENAGPAQKDHAPATQTARLESLQLNSGTLIVDGTVRPAPAMPADRALLGNNKTLGILAAGENGAAENPFPNSQHYVQVAPASRPANSQMIEAAPPAGPAPILASFKMEQNGNALRIVDRDGSVYNGSFQLAKETAPAISYAFHQLDSDTNIASDELKRVTAQAPQSYLFQVSGTNRSLKQNVMFQGNLFAAPNASTPLAWSNGMAVAGGRFQAPVQMFRLPLENSRVSGTAVINNLQTLQINAVPASPSSAGKQ